MSNSKKKNRCIATNDISVIKSALEYVSPSMISYIEGANGSEFILRYKSITHSDLANGGKRNGPKEPLEKNFLYYLSNEEMHRIEVQNGTEFETAKQSNIGLPDTFYDDLGVPHPRSSERKNQGSLCLNDYVDVKVVNDSLTYFTEYYTKIILTKLGKKLKWENKSVYSLDSGVFTDIRLSEAVHGIGTSSDDVFSKIRLSIFLNDTIYFLIENNKLKPRKTLYVLLEKNPIFYTLAEISNAAWARFLSVNKKQTDAKIESQSMSEIDDEKSRKKQSAWKKRLAMEMMNFTTHEGEVFCPLTYTTANFEDVPMLFIASHIKRFADSDCDEAYDINNGLLLCANADALFDKHMITITPEKELKFSFLIDNDKLLKQRLLLNQDIFKDILNDKRMEYLLDHNKIFEEKEKLRKESGYSYEEEEYRSDSEENDIPKMDINLVDKQYSISEYPTRMVADCWIDASVGVLLPNNTKEDLINKKLDLVLMYALGPSARPKTEPIGKIALGIKEEFLTVELRKAYMQVCCIVFHYWKNSEARMYKLQRPIQIVREEMIPSSYITRQEKEAKSFLLIDYDTCPILEELDVLKVQKYKDARYLPFVTPKESVLK